MAGSGGISGEHSVEIARFSAFCALVQEHLVVQDVASWLEQPLVPGLPVTGMDVVLEQRYEDVLSLAAQHEDPETLLDRVRPRWREEVAVNAGFETFIAPDGMPGIRVVD